MSALTLRPNLMALVSDYDKEANQVCFKLIVRFSFSTPSVFSYFAADVVRLKSTEDVHERHLILVNFCSL